MSDRTTQPILRQQKQIRLKIIRSLSLVFLTLSILGSFSLSASQDPVVLVVTGKHGHETESEPLELTLSMLEALPSETIKTSTPWTEGIVVWEGVRINILLKYLKTQSTRFNAKALDGYEAVFENIDIEKYPVIIAYKRDGEYMPIRELGPLWIMLPFDDFDELTFTKHRPLSVWQLNAIDIL